MGQSVAAHDPRAFYGEVITTIASTRGACHLHGFAEALRAFPRLRLRGLMTLPAPVSGLERQRQPFRLLRQMLEELRADGHAVDTLSMGMSDDMEAAIAEGATWVRIGTAIFGRRG